MPLWYLCPHCRQWHSTDHLVTSEPCPITKNSIVVERDGEGKWRFRPEPPKAETDYERGDFVEQVGYLSGATVTGGTVSLPMTSGTIQPYPGTCERCGMPVSYGGRYCSKCSFDMFYASGL